MSDLIFWGVIASPFQLKMQSLGDYAGLHWQRWPDQATVKQTFRTIRLLETARKSATIQKYEGHDPELDEYPAVPYYSFDGEQFFYDSTALAQHLDSIQHSHPALIPRDPALAFICLLIDEAFDEFGLYMVHHNRWVTSAATNCMGRTTAKEFRKIAPPGIRHIMARRLARRQVRRCAYLFSVAPQKLELGVSAALTPRALTGFPPTHQLLDAAWRQYLAAMELLLAAQPYLLGNRFTLADASAYGQLSMNLIDGRAADLIQELAPRTYQWLGHIRDGEHVNQDGNLSLNPALTPLIQVICETFVPLMQQNEAAYQQQKSDLTPFNEAGFDRGQGLYDGKLQGHAFRAVVKTFQVAVWQNLCQRWAALDSQAQQQIQQAAPSIQAGFFK